MSGFLRNSAVAMLALVAAACGSTAPLTSVGTQGAPGAQALGSDASQGLDGSAAGAGGGSAGTAAGTNPGASGSVVAGTGTAATGAAASPSGVGAGGKSATVGPTTTTGRAAPGPGGGKGPAAPGQLPAFPEDGVTASTITIGGIFPISSGFSQVFNSKELARMVTKLVERTNAAGGINGRKVRFVWYDDGFDPGRGAEVVKKLVEQDKVTAIISTLSTFTTQTTAKYLLDHNVAHIAPEGYQPESYSMPNFYPVTNFFDVQGARIGKYLTCELGIKRVGVWSIADFPASKLGGDSIVKAVQACGGTVVDREDPKFFEADYTPYILRMRAANPDVIASAMDPLDDAVMVQTAQTQNYRPPKGMMFLSAMSAFKSIAQGMGSFADGFWSVSEFDASVGANSPLLNDFLTFAKSIGLDGSDRFPLEAWSGWAIFEAAARAAGPELNRTTLRRELDKLDIDLGFACEPFHFRPGPKKANPCLRVMQWDAKKQVWNTLKPFERVVG
ncbi:MAG: branched-chain amino acid transport system substrate-binding protein [Actinomycetota bacterium]|nr:branched-chain amino acid transport system substrate-binding protein [Actinomycetota bacterium]MDQ1501253.1 branched-chain amino acid transport system substrate-binding protein [Actinomycetota bacterium]